MEENWWKESLCGLVVQEGEEVMIFGPEITSSRFTNTKEQEDTEVLFYPQRNYNSYDQCNPLSSKSHKCHILQMALRECQRM